MKSKPEESVDHTVDTSVSEVSTGFSQRLALLMGKMSTNAFAIKCGISDTLMRKYLNGSLPGLDILHRICKANGVNVGWLAAGEGSPNSLESLELGSNLQSGYVSIPLHNEVRASAGNGSLTWDEQPDDFLQFREDWITHEISAKVAYLKLIRVSGDSMERVLYDEDVIMIDTSKTTFTHDGIYTFLLGEALMVKTLQRIAGGFLVVSEYKDKYPAYSLTFDEMKNCGFRIVGLVRWSAHTF